MEVFVFDTAFIKKLNDTGYQHISLCNGEGKKIIPFNPEKKKVQAKITEIKNRLANLPDGLYQILCNWNYGGTGAPDIFLIKKGNTPVENFAPPTTGQKIVSLKERAQDNVLTYDKALENIEKIANLEARVRELEAENKRLTIDLELAEEEIESGTPALAENKGMDATIGGWLKEITPILTPLADRYFDTENRKLAIQEREQYFKYNGKTPTPGQGQKRKAKVVQSRERTIKHTFPDINNQEEIDNYFDALEKLDEAKFIEVCKMLSVENPPLYKLVEAEFSNEEVEEPQN